MIALRFPARQVRGASDTGLLGISNAAIKRVGQHTTSGPGGLRTPNTPEPASSITKPKE